MTEKYNAGASYVAKIKACAEKLFGIPVSQETIETWIVLAEGCDVADDAIDSITDPDRRQEVMNELIGYIEGLNEAIPSDDPTLNQLMEPVRSLYQTLPQQSKEALTRHLRVFSRVTEKARNETDIYKYSKWKMLEGQLNIEIFHDTAPESMKSHPNFPRYRRTINRVVRARNNLDALLDLKDDLASGITLIQPTIYNKAYLLKDAITQIINSTRSLDIEFIRNRFGLKKFDGEY